jgi:hypothetical protein
LPRLIITSRLDTAGERASSCGPLEKRRHPFPQTATNHEACPRGRFTAGALTGFQFVEWAPIIQPAATSWRSQIPNTLSGLHRKVLPGGASINSGHRRVNVTYRFRHRLAGDGSPFSAAPAWRFRKR